MEGLVGDGAEEVEVADDGEGNWARREAVLGPDFGGDGSDE